MGPEKYVGHPHQDQKDLKEDQELEKEQEDWTSYWQDKKAAEKEKSRSHGSGYGFYEGTAGTPYYAGHDGGEDLPYEGGHYQPAYDASHYYQPWSQDTSMHFYN